MVWGYVQAIYAIYMFLGGVPSASGRGLHCTILYGDTLHVYTI